MILELEPALSLCYIVASTAAAHLTDKSLKPCSDQELAMMVRKFCQFLHDGFDGGGALSVR